MPVNLANAFGFVFKEKNWFVKMFIGALLIFFVKVIALSMDVVHSDALPHLENLFIKNNFKGSLALVFRSHYPFGSFSLDAFNSFRLHYNHNKTLYAWRR